MKVGGLLFVLGCALVAQDGAESRTAATRPLTPAERVAAIDQEYEDAITAYSNAYEAAATPEEKEKLRFPTPDAWHSRLFAIAKEDPKSPGAEAALEWIVSHSNRGQDFAWALALLATVHLESPTLKKACERLEFAECPEAETFLRMVRRSSPHRDVRALATYTLAKHLKWLGGSAAFIQSSDDAGWLERTESHYGREEFARRKALDAGAVLKGAEALFVEVTEKYADVPGGFGGPPLGPRAAGFLFEMRNLAVGKVAPEIEGENVDGKPMRLTDFRGKVVVLDFWGFW